MIPGMTTIQVRMTGMRTAGLSFSTIGLIGMNEACRNLLGTDTASEKGQLFSLRVPEYMRERPVAFQEETGDNYNLEATPAEGTSYRLARLDTEQSDIQSANPEGSTPR
jgi:anaerobic ribonucleoside-triphosphate reductase